MDRVGFYFRFQDGKVREIPQQNITEKVDRKLLTFKVSYVAQQHFAFGDKEIMIFYIRRYEGICAVSHGVLYEKTARSPAHRYFPDLFT